MIHFSKYQGTGNDFIMIDGRDLSIRDNLGQSAIARLCDRRFGIGADGLIILEDSSNSDFDMVYYNSDGRQSSMCGNGGRCIVQFAKDLNIIDKQCSFRAIDGIHKAVVEDNGLVALQMLDLGDYIKHDLYYFLDTGSPHIVQFTENVGSLDVKALGAKMRYSDQYKKYGVNVNFVEEKNASIFVRTYERGVEDETLSCGTGVTAAALAAALKYHHFEEKKDITVNTLGGPLNVKFKKNKRSFSDIWLIGPARKVYTGVANLSEILEH